MANPESIIEDLTGHSPEDVAECSRDDLEAARHLLDEALALQARPERREWRRRRRLRLVG